MVVDEREEHPAAHVKRRGAMRELFFRGGKAEADLADPGLGDVGG